MKGNFGDLLVDVVATDEAAEFAPAAEAVATVPSKMQAKRMS